MGHEADNLAEDDNFGIILCEIIVVLESVVTQGLPVLLIWHPLGSQWKWMMLGGFDGVWNREVTNTRYVCELSSCAAMPVVIGVLHRIFHPRLLKSFFQSYNLCESWFINSIFPLLSSVLLKCIYWYKSLISLNSCKNPRLQLYGSSFPKKPDTGINLVGNEMCRHLNAKCWSKCSMLVIEVVPATRASLVWDFNFWIDGTFCGNLCHTGKQKVELLFLDMLETLSQAEYCICSTSQCAEFHMVSL